MEYNEIHVGDFKKKLIMFYTATFTSYIILILCILAVYLVILLPNSAGQMSVSSCLYPVTDPTSVLTSSPRIRY